MMPSVKFSPCDKTPHHKIYLWFTSLKAIHSCTLIWREVRTNLHLQLHRIVRMQVIFDLTRCMESWYPFSLTKLNLRPRSPCFDPRGQALRNGFVVGRHLPRHFSWYQELPLNTHWNLEVTLWKSNVVECGWLWFLSFCKLPFLYSFRSQGSKAFF